jgi:hypothetical protein
MKKAQLLSQALPHPATPAAAVLAAAALAAADPLPLAEAKKKPEPNNLIKAL